MLDATDNMDEDVKVLEVVSDAEEVAVAMESEHEEGEISEDDDDDEVGLPGQQHFPHHYPSDYHKERQPGKNASATSAVVIYDDRGRTAIFTSPRKNLRDSGSYKRRADSGRRWKQEEMEKRRHKDDEARKHQKDNGMGRKWQILDNEGGASGASTKRTKYIRQGLRRLGSSAGWESDKVPGAKNKRSLDQPRHLVAHRSHTSSSDSDSSYCSYSSYSSSSHSGSDSPVQRRGRGKENKRSGTASRARSRSPPEQGFSSTKKKLAYKKSSEKWPSKKSPPWAPPVTQEKESARASSPVEAASKISKSWGNGRKSPRPYLRHTLPTSSSRKTEVKASHHKTNKSKAKENVVKISDDESEEKCDKSPRAKCDTSPKGNGGEVPLISSQKQLPRGSFGEMLLKKTLKGKLKACPLANKSVEKGETSGEAGGSKKEEISEISEVLQQDCDTLDQEDEDELQLRLIALQSSLKVLSDVRREGCQSINTGNMIVDLSLSLPQDSIEQPLEKEEEGKEAAPSDLPDQRNSKNIDDFQDQLSDHHILLQSDAESSTPLKSNQSFDTKLEEGTPKEDEVDLILDDLSQSSTRSQPGSSITGLELELDAISTNKSYLDDGEDSTRQLATNIGEQLQREIKDLADSNQDPVDMDICDSSPSEEDESFFDEDILKDIGEDISLDKVSSPDPSSAPNIGSQAKDYPVPVLDPGGQESFHHNSSSNNTKSSSNNNSNSNFQIPVEWAYMMPPPPPPDQPPNDISNINNWCYDQNMYLQTMQSSYDSNEQFQQYNSYGTPTSDWGLQPQQPTQWNESKPENYENVSEQTENIQENAETPASPEHTTSKTLTPEKEEPKPDNSPQEDLKDLPAEHYQAFMSAVLNQQKTRQKNSGTQRNLIEVQLIKYGSSSNVQAEAVKNASSGVGTSGGAVLQVNKRSRARRRKRERQKEKIKQLKQLKAQEKLAKGKESVAQSDLQPGVDSVPSVSEDEDEDLLRAQLLIDLSRKKNQKQIEPVVELPKSCLSDYQTATADNIQAAHQAHSSHSSGYAGHESTPPQSYPSSLESCPRLRPVAKTAVMKMHQQARFRENSPTHKMKVTLRHGLSDIGGISLDPKSSRYDYPIPKDNHSQKDMPKFKFPNIKPVIINLESDSDDENEDGEESSQDKSTDEPQPSGSGEGDGVLSSSIDLLLKSMRNANKPEKDAKPGTQDKKGTALTKRTPVRKASQSYSTPNVVRHLSRTQQVEYRRLKEQLREKEMLQKKRQELLLRQKVLQKKMASAARISPESPQSGDNGGEMSDGGAARDLPSANIPQVKSQTPSRTEEENCDQGDTGGKPQTQGETPPLPHSVLQDTREVILKETGGLQIQLALVNRDKEGSNTVSADESCQGGSGTVKSVEMKRDRDLSCEGSPAEDEDEEMLRLMVLKTLQKKVIDKAKSNDEENCESVDADSKSEKNDESYMSSNSEIPKVVIRQRIEDVPTDEKETMAKAVEVAARSVVIENQTDLLENSKDVHQEGDVNGGEWMVLDEVLEEIDEGNGENANSEELAVVKEEHGNKVKKLLTNEEDRGPTLDTKETEGPSSESVSKTSENETLVQEAKNNNECNNVSQLMESENTAKNNNECYNVSQLMESENTEVENQTPADHAQGLADSNLNEEIEDSRENDIKPSHNGERMDSGENEMEGAGGSAIEVLGNSKGDERYKGEDTQQVPIKVSKKSAISVDEPVDSVLPFTTQEHSSSEHTEKRTEVVIADKSQDEENNSLSAGKEELASPIGISCVSGENDSESTERKEKAEVSSGTEVETLNSITSENNSNIQTIQKQVQIHGDMEGKKSLGHLSEKIEKNEQLEKDVLLVSESTKTLKGSPVCSTSVNNLVRQNSAIRTPNSLPTTLQKQKSNAVGNTSKSSSLSDVDNVARKPVRTKRLLLLKRVEHEYTQKRIAMNEVISQLASLVHEATEEERQRQSLKSTITKLREKLGQMETQLEDKASKLKAKMARIRNLQTQITKDREEISQLEHKGEILGKKELGSDYKLPKVLGSPHSKSKDHMRKKQLAHNIDALRQQIGQVYNRQMYSKTQARLEAKTKAVEKHISPLINVDKKEEGTSVRRKVLQSGQAPVGQQNLSPGNGGTLHVATSLSATQNVSVAWNKKLFDSSLNMQSAVSIKGAPSMIKNKAKRKIMPDNGNAITKAAKTENVCASKGTEMGAIIDNRAQEANETLPTKELDCKTETVHPASRQSAMSDPENVSFEDKQRQKLVSPTKEQNRSLDVTERIDEMNMLCPYDLLGRCNDDSCSYQHLRPPSHLTSKTAEIQRDPTGLSSHASVSGRQGALEESTVRITSSNETEPKDPLTNGGSAENIDRKEQTIPQVDCKGDGLQVIVSNSQMPCSDKADSNLNLCQTNKEDFIFVKPTQHCGDSEEIPKAFMSACNRSEKLNQEADSIIEQIALTPCIYSEKKNETSENCETLVSLNEAVEESELLKANNDKHRNLHSALPLQLKEGLPEVLEEFSKQSPSESNTDIKSVPETDIKDELPKDLQEEKIQESDEKEESGELAAQVLSMGEKTSSAEQEEELRVEVKEASTIALKKKKPLPKRSTPRKRTRNSDLNLELDVLSQSPEPTARRTRRSINQKDVSGALTATNRNSSKKDLTKERSAPAKASPRRGGRKTRGGKR